MVSWLFSWHLSCNRIGGVHTKQMDSKTPWTRISHDHTGQLAAGKSASWNHRYQDKVVWPAVGSLVVRSWPPQETWWLFLLYLQVGWHTLVSSKYHGIVLIEQKVDLTRHSLIKHPFPTLRLVEIRINYIGEIHCYRD